MLTIAECSTSDAFSVASPASQNRIGNGHMEIERTCPVCAHDSTVVYAEARIDPKRLGEFAYASRKMPEYMHLRLMQCPQCDLVYANPVPAPSELESAYREAAYDSKVEAEYAAQTYAAQVRRFCDRLPDRVGTLDIGAGDGAFCGQLQKLGFTNIIGLEPSSAPIAAAEPSVKDCLKQEMFVPGRFEANSFSLVTCFQTIEHVPEPKVLCQEAARILKPGGALCLVGHNRRSLSCKILGRRSPIFDVEHLQLFSPESMRRLLTDSGLTDVVVRPIYNRYPLAYWARLFPFPRAIKDLLIKGLNATGIGRIPFPLPAGNMVAWGFRK